MDSATKASAGIRKIVAFKERCKLAENAHCPLQIRLLCRLGRQILTDSGALIAQFPLKWMSNDEVNVSCEDYSLGERRLEIRKPAQRGRFQKLEMRIAVASSLSRPFEISAEN